MGIQLLQTRPNRNLTQLWNLSNAVGDSLSTVYVFFGHSPSLKPSIVPLSAFHDRHYSVTYNRKEEYSSGKLNFVKSLFDFHHPYHYSVHPYHYSVPNNPYHYSVRVRVPNNIERVPNINNIEIFQK